MPLKRGQGGCVKWLIIMCLLGMPALWGSTAVAIEQCSDSVQTSRAGVCAGPVSPACSGSTTCACKHLVLRPGPIARCYHTLEPVLDECLYVVLAPADHVERGWRQTHESRVLRECNLPRFSSSMVANFPDLP